MIIAKVALIHKHKRKKEVVGMQDGCQTLANKRSVQGHCKDPGCCEGRGPGDTGALAHTKCLKLLFASAAESLQHTCSWSDAAIPSHRQSHPFNPLRN